MFEGKNTKKIEYLDKERKKLWERIVELEKKIEIRPSDYEKEARQASKKTAEYRNKTEERLNDSIEIFNNLKTVHGEILYKSNEIEILKVQLDETLESSRNSSKLITERSSELLINVDKIQEVFENHPNLEKEVSELEELIETLEEDASKANSTYKGILSKKSEIDELYREIIGYSDESSEGEKVEVEGLKSELENSYNELEGKSKNLENRIDKLEEESQIKVDSFINENDTHLGKIIEDSKTEYETINKRIESLLPNAMTAGLSSAFIAKKDDEVKLYEEYKSKFSQGILFLSLTSLLPIAISIFFLSTGVSLTEVIARIPKVILAFMPLYVPLIWVTISANKKVNLSKRLIEEYSHKQVLSMTIEGLSNQIDNIEDNDISKELRTKLLNSFLLVTSENPGKLISNYQKSDNPILNILDRDDNHIKEKKQEKSIMKSVEEKTKDLVEKGVDEIEDGAINVAKNVINQ